MSWVPFAGASVVALGLFAVLGVPIAYALGLRGFAPFALAPVFATTIVCGASIVLPRIGIGWSPFAVVGVEALVLAALLICRRVLPVSSPVPPPRRRFDIWLALAIAAGAALITARIVTILGGPDAISQTFDNVFHLNAVRWVLDTGSASSFDIGYMTNPDGPAPFYPAGWHGFVALVAQLSGASVPVAINAFVTVVSALVWPLGAIYLTRSLFGRSPALTLTAALLTASIPAFPYLLMDYGVLYPFQFGVALLPGTLAITAHLLRVTRGRDAVGAGWWAVALLGALPGLALVHPGAFMGWLALGAPLVVIFVVRAWIRTVSVRGRIGIATATVVYLVIGVILVHALRPPAEARGWPPQMSVGEALRQLLTVAPWYGVASGLVALVVVAGIVWACVVRSPSALAALGIYVVVGVLFVIVSAVQFPLRDIFTAPWYNNMPRIAAMLTIAFVPLGAYGVACTASVGLRALRRVGWRRPATTALLTVVGLTVVVATQVGPLSPMPVAQAAISGAYALTPDSPLLSRDEAALIARIDSHVPEGEAIAGSPWTGTSVAYALSGRKTLMPHVQMTLSDDIETINDGLADARPGDPVCEAVADLDVGFVLDFGTREVHGGDHVYPGLRGLDHSDAVRLVDSVGDARLYEVTGCTP
ncbi:DUF6541 family protein [uncultured Microbacterium sp.]|uniref:DUF6541 family protein n=1 Tax=uncultured Microbacterium sp. TaxID=191216 RepID=UPI0035CCA0F6